MHVKIMLHVSDLVSGRDTILLSAYPTVKICAPESENTFAKEDKILTSPPPPLCTKTFIAVLFPAFSRYLLEKIVPSLGSGLCLPMYWPNKRRPVHTTKLYCMYKREGKNKAFWHLIEFAKRRTFVLFFCLQCARSRIQFALYSGDVCAISFLKIRLTFSGQD